MSNLEQRFLGLEHQTISNDVIGLYDNALDNSEKLAGYAADNNLKIIYPADNELFIDMDSEQAHTLFLDQVEVLRQVIEVTHVNVYPSRSGLPNRHAIVTVRLPKNRGVNRGVLIEMERLALQTMLGSDRRCELLRYVRYCFKDPHPTLFLEKQ